MDLTREGRKRRMPDVLDAIAALSSDAVPTPPELARSMLDLLPEDVWSNPDLKWLDPAVKSGSILREIASRLMVGLADWEPDPHERAQHIMTNMLHGLSITKLHGEMGRRSVYRSKDAISVKAVGRGEFFNDSQGNIQFVHAEHKFKKSRRELDTGNCEICGAPVGLDRGVDRENYAYAFIHDKSLMERLKGMKFDVIIGNPPYQVGLDDNTRSKPIYHRFVENAIALESKYVAMIVPSRWFFGGLGLDDFRERMIADRRLSKIVDNPKLFDCFPGVEIKGGVNYFLWDRDHDADCEFSTRIDGTVESTTTRDLREGQGVVVRDNNAIGIIEKVLLKRHPSVEGSCSATLPFDIRDNHKTRETAREGDVPVIHGSHVGYLPREAVNKNSAWIDEWKVLLPMASDGHGRAVSYVLGEPIAVAPGSICTLTYIVAGRFGTKDEARNFALYLTTKFVRFLTLQRKSTQHVTPDRLRFVPEMDMSRTWTDDDLYGYFGLTKTESAYIEGTIHARHAVLSLDSPVPSSHLPGGSKYKAPGSRVAAEEDVEEDDQ